jgi:predicted lactoylglutathione lyase
MIGYVTLGTNDLARATKFYDALLAILGAKHGWESDKMMSWSTSPTGAALILIKPADGKAATVGNGVMVSILATSKDEVGKLHAKALALGGKDEGAVGPRGDGFYAGYFRDLDGNKLCAYFLG